MEPRLDPVSDVGKRAPAPSAGLIERNGASPTRINHRLYWRRGKGPPGSS